MTAVRAILSYSNSSHYFVSSGKSVVFRFDDVPCDFLKNYDLFCNAELAVMDLFMKKRQKLVLALVTKYLQGNGVLTKKIGEGLEKNLFELAIHGWDHTDHSELDEKQQVRLLHNATKRVEEIFGNCSQIFIPPYNSFNDHTLAAMDKVGLRILSSELDLDKSNRFSSTDRQVRKATNISHIPQMTSFEEFTDHMLFRKDVKTIIEDISINIARYGYTVITMHPQSFMSMESKNDVYNNGDLDIQRLNNLADLIDTLMSRNIEIKTFSGVIGTK